MPLRPCAIVFFLLAAAAPAYGQPAEDGLSPLLPAAPDAPVFCNLACQIAKSPFAPGGGGGISANKELEILGKEFDGLELGVTRPAAEELLRQMPTESMRMEQFRQLQ